MLVYRFDFSRRAAGRPITIRDVTGATVNTGTLPDAPATSGGVTYQTSLAEGTYVGSTSVNGRTLKSEGYLDIPDSIAAGGTGLDPADPQTITAPWEFDPPVVGTLNEDFESDAVETVAVTIKPKGLGTAALNVIRYDDAPVDGSGYGVAHIDSDGGGGFAGGRIYWSEGGHVHINGATGADPLIVSIADYAILDVGGTYAAVLMNNPDPAARCLALGTATGQTADMIEGYNGDNNDYPFRVTPTGEVHADGGVVLKSPNGTAYRLVVANDGSLSTEAV